MSQPTNSPLLLFYPTSPVHVRDVKQVIQKLLGWRSVAIVYQSLARVAPGIATALSEQQIESIEIGQESEFQKQLPSNTAALLLGAVFEPFALDLFAWAKQRHVPVIAIQEVAQLALNQFDINNYDAPFDRLFLASSDENRRFLDLGYPSEMLTISGLLANDRANMNQGIKVDGLLCKIGISEGIKPIVYTTSPLRGRLSLHNKDDLHFRQDVLTQIAVASRKNGRKVVVKLHPNEDPDAARQQIEKIIPNAIVLGREFNMDELFPAAGVLINRGNSQTCLDAVLRGIPTVVIACGLRTLFHDDGGAYVVDELSRLSETIERAFNEEPIDFSRVQAKHFFVPPEGVAGFIAKEISELASDPQPATEDTWNWLLKTTLFIGRHDRALWLCERLGSRTVWQESVYVALKAHAEGRLENAIAAWRDCASLDHDWFFPHYEMAHGFQATRQFDKAIEHAHKAIELHPPFHSLWHEIPMRVVIMASHRHLGELSRAASELKLMEDRDLVEIVPELLIEKAAQLSSSNDRLDEAAHCLDNAHKQLVDYPVNKKTDVQLLERAAFQFMGLGQQWENNKDLHAAAKCYNLATETDPSDHRSRFGMARVALKQGKLFTAIEALRLLIEIPNGPKQIVHNIFSSAGAARILSYWPATPKSIKRPMKLAAYTFAWAVHRTLKSRFRDFFEASTALLMIWMFIAKHFYLRLCGESVSVR